jgi:excisionase family DNA binding protein
MHRKQPTPRRKPKSLPVIPENAVFLTSREVAGLLRKSLKSVYRLADAKAIAHVRDAGNLLFVRSSVNDYIAARFVPSSDTKQVAA